MTYDSTVATIFSTGYKPGWTFRVSTSTESRFWMQVVFFVDDVRSQTGRQVMQHGRKWFLSEHMTRSEVVLTVFKALLTAEEHECRERFTYRGQRVCGPHMDLARVAELMESGDLGTEERT